MASSSSQAETFGVDRRRLVLLVVLGIALIAGAVALVGRVADFGDMLDAVRQLHWVWLVVCLAGQLVSYLGYVLAFREVARLDGGPRLSVWQSVRVVGIGFGAYVLGSAAGGLAVEYWALSRAGLDKRETARRLLGFKTLEWGVLALLAALAAIAVLVRRPETVPAGMALGWIAAVAVAVPLAVLVSTPAVAERLADTSWDEPRPEGLDPGRWLGWLRGKSRAACADVVGGLLVLRGLLRDPRHHAFSVAGAALHWVGLLIVLYGAARAFGIQLGVDGLVLAFSTGYAAMALPLPAGGAGGIEIALASSMHAVGAGLGAALVAALVFRFVTFWLPILPALPLAASARRLHEELPETAEGET